VAELRMLDEDRPSLVPLTRDLDLVATGVIRPARADGDPFAHWPAAGDTDLPPGTVATLIDEERSERQADCRGPGHTPEQFCEHL